MAHSRRGSGGLCSLRCLRLCGSLRGGSCRLRLLSRLFRSILCRFCCGILTYRLCSLSGFGRLRCRSFLLFSRGSSRSGRCGRSAGLQCVCSSSCRLLSLLLGSGVSNLEAAPSPDRKAPLRKLRTLRRIRWSSARMWISDPCRQVSALRCPPVPGKQRRSCR